MKRLAAMTATPTGATDLALKTGLPENGGARRNRTADLVIANDALSQLSYGPVTGRWRAYRGARAVLSSARGQWRCV